MANFINEKGRITVSADEEGSRLDRMLLRFLGGGKRTLLMRLIRKGNVRVNGKRCKANHHLALHDEVFVPASLRQSDTKEISHGDIPNFLLQQVAQLAILFEDEWLLVINKPAGLVVHGGSGHDAGLIEALKVSRHLPDLRLAHRLDRDTSGVLLLAKNLLALRNLTESFRDRDMDKTYIAWVHGHPEPHAARITSRLSKGVSIAGERMVVDDIEGKVSTTDYQVMLECEKDDLDYALLALKPHSGRTHQLRVQLQNERHAILGDPKYAEKGALKKFKALGGKGLMLHAWRLRLLHPVTQKELVFIAPFPERMTKAPCTNLSN
ncbi:MAG: RluA family pseudouridine synthase [Mariprofundaceae bacterium]|nr:RluA family pseudouridine synthase [Mariprofundaceae bacterium]